MNFSRVFGAQSGIPAGHIVTVEADISRGLHAFSIVGLPDKAVEEARDRVASAIKNSGFTSPKSTNKKVVISLAPAALRKEGAAFDLPIALSYLLATDDVTFDTEKRLFVGELALDGVLRPTPGVLSITLAARAAGFEEIFVPHENAREAALVSGISVFGAHTLSEVIEHCSDESSFVLAPTERAKIDRARGARPVLETIRGQEHAKRALEIAAAGGHNVALFGPPGTGKTMLARALRSLLPPLSEEETIEVTSIHSYAGTLESDVVSEPPFRSPHHSSSHVALVGGGSVPKPGEVTLAHRGVLFMDEFPEFARDCINVLRQPLEDRVVSVARARGSATFPANFILVAALNPCPCGHYGTTRCSCPAHLVERYRHKVSGPIADRIDMWIHVGEIPPESLNKKGECSTNETTDAQARVHEARERQHNRFENTNLITNSDMGAGEINNLANVTKEAEKALTDAARTLHLSPRGYHRTIKLARTIADLAGSETIETSHMLEALQYRPKEW